MKLRYSRNGKLRFFRIGRVCLSFCLAKPTPLVVTEAHVIGATAFALIGVCSFIVVAL